MSLRKYNGEGIKEVWWPDTDTEKGKHIKSEGETVLYLEITFLGDHEQVWIVETFGGNEIARHNPRYVETIIWAERKVEK